MIAMSKSTPNTRLVFGQINAEYAFGIRPNQRRIRVWYSAKSTPNTRLVFGQINAEYAFGIRRVSLRSTRPTIKAISNTHQLLILKTK